MSLEAIETVSQREVTKLSREEIRRHIVSLAVRYNDFHRSECSVVLVKGI